MTRAVVVRSVLSVKLDAKSLNFFVERTDANFELISFLLPHLVVDVARKAGQTKECSLGLRK